MDAKPQRPTRTLRPRNDENRPMLQNKSTNVAATKTAQPQKAAVGLKAAAKRAAFTDVSNKPKASVDKENGKMAVVIQEKKSTTAISKPAQRVKSAISTSTSTTLVTTQTAGPRRATRKTTVYEDRKPSPKRNSPKRLNTKTSRDAVVKKKEVAPPAIHQGPVRRSQALALPIPEVEEEEPVYSDEVRIYDDEGDAVAELEEYDDDDDATDVEEVDEKANRKGVETDVLSEYESEGEDDTAFTRSRGGDNTTGVTTQVIIPRWTKKASEELELLRSEFKGADLEEDEGDISMVAEYGDEIFEYMRELEIKMVPNAHYMDFQTEIKWSMRAILMDWLVQVHTRFNLLPETMFLCTNYIDRFLSTKVVSLGKLQLVGATALFVAAKYEEINCPSVHEIVYMVDGGYTAEEILKAERFMLSQLNFQLGWPGPMSFLRRVSKADDYDLETRTLAKYFLEITIMDERFVASPPSFLAAGAHCLSRHMLNKGEWTRAHTYYSGYTAAQLEPLVQTLVECCENPKAHHSAVYEKYSDRRYKRASVYVANWMTAELAPGADEEEC